MCRSIKTLRPPYVEERTEQDVHAAALQYVRKVAGMREPSARNRAAFDAAVAAVAAATDVLLADITVRPGPAGRDGGPPAFSAAGRVAHDQRGRRTPGPPTAQTGSSHDQS